MNFLEAQKIVSSFSGGKSLEFSLAMSGSAEKLHLYLRAAAAQAGFELALRTLPFNTLGQALFQPPPGDCAEVFLLFPWDFAPETDWRSGVPAEEIDAGSLRRRAEATAEVLLRRRARAFYVPAPLVPLFSNPTENGALSAFLSSLAGSIQARFLPSGVFSLASYLSSGCPIGGQSLGQVASAIMEVAVAQPEEICKVLVTDFDQVLWSGVLAEDGLEGIHYAPEGLGYRHFLYQSLLAKLRREGVLLVGVSRNQTEVALEPLRSGRMLLREEDFVSIQCSYGAKSAQIRQVAEHLNLGLQSVAFVDDNPVELAEVSMQLPDVHCLSFPQRDDQLPEFFSRISGLFPKATVTEEDRERTSLYRRRMQGMAPSKVAGADLHEFLLQLRMELTLHRRTANNFARALQLINKTNQFNLNGIRFTEDELKTILDQGGRLFSASLSDRHGTHGEILACLVDGNMTVRSLVMSCRVFQRRVEHGFLAWLAQQKNPPSEFNFQPTPHNLPLQDFLKNPAFSHHSGKIRMKTKAFVEAHDSDLKLFNLVVDIP